MKTAIAQTASITLLTGLPGSGKTLRTVHFIKEAIEAGELVFVTNLNGLKVSHAPFEDPRDWEDLPSGSILVVDEAQQFFRSRRSGEAPPYLTAMETIRHKGVRLVLTTQQPEYLDIHLRGLVGLHEHLVRENGKEAVRIYRHNEVMDNVRSARARSRYDSEVWKYPKALFDLYQSAEVHTVKRTVSAKMKRGLLLVGLVGVLLTAAGVALSNVMGGDEPAPMGMVAEGAGPQAGAPPRTTGTVTAFATAEDWAERFTPRVPQLPMSAPAFDGREVRAEPRIACGVGATMGCVCFTEQGTRYELDQLVCAELVQAGGVYDPFRAPEERPEYAAPEPMQEDLREAILGGVGGLPPTVTSSRAEDLGQARKAMIGNRKAVIPDDSTL